MKWIALALFLVGMAIAIGAICVDEARRFSDGGFIAWLTVLVTTITSAAAGFVWLFALVFMSL